MTPQQIQDALKDRNLLEVSRVTGISYPTVRKIAAGNMDNVKYVSAMAIVEYLGG